MTDLPPPPPLPTPPGWEGLLGAGEYILWQGRPSPRLQFAPRQIPRILLGLIFTGFSVFWMSQAMKAGGVFWTFGLIFFFVGLYHTAQAISGDGVMLRFTHYTLTNQRALVATNAPFLSRSLKSYPITATTPIDFRNDDPASIHFARAPRFGHFGDFGVPIGFESIKNGLHVLALLRKIQRGEA